MCVKDYHVSNISTDVAQGPGIVIAHPGQDVELLCTVIVTSANEEVAWTVNHKGPYRLNALHNELLSGYNVNGSNLVVEGIMINDNRNDTEYRCVVVLQGTATIQRESSVTILFVTGKCDTSYVYLCFIVAMYIWHVL